MPDPIKIEPLFSAWLRTTRKARGWSQASCARKAAMTPQQWNYLETKTRRPHMETVELVARVLEAPLSEALDAAGFTQIEQPEMSASKAEAIARVTEGLEKLDTPAVEEIADLISFKLSRKR